MVILYPSLEIGTEKALSKRQSNFNFVLEVFFYSGIIISAIRILNFEMFLFWRLNLYHHHHHCLEVHCWTTTHIMQWQTIITVLGRRV